MKENIKKILRRIIPKDRRYQILVFKYKLNYVIKQKVLKLKKLIGLTNAKEIKLYKEKAKNINKKILEICDSELSKSVYIFQLQFFDQKGINFFSGGGERYVVDLANIFQKLGFKPILIQVGESGKKIWVKNKYGLTVLGIPTTFEDYFNIIGYLNSPQLAIYSGYQYWNTCNKIHHPSILISHGITWDTPYMDADSASIKETLNRFNYLVSVDTSTISYLRSSFSHSLSKKNKAMFYVPNYVDKKIFTPIKQVKKRKNIKITFPRRLCNERGYWLFSKIIEPILNKYKNIEIELVGYIHNEEIANNLEKLIKKFGNRIKHYLVDQKKMNLVYQNTDISVIPTVFSEGTSLSCLEAMSCGNTIIATNIGGLPNLIIDEFNGLLINPNEKELFGALCKVIDSQKIREELSKNALKVSEKFTKEIWTQRWTKIIKTILSDQKEVFRDSNKIIDYLKSINNDKPIIIFASSFSYYNSLLQRPHHVLKKISNQGYVVLWLDDQVENLEAIDKNFYLLPSIYLEKILKSDINVVLDVYAHHHNSKRITETLSKYSSKTKLIVEYVDDFDIWKDKKVKNFLKKQFKKYATNNKALFLITADSLYQKAIKFGIKKDRILISRNAVNLDDFTKSKKISSTMTPIIAKNKPIIGYYGALDSNWFDYDLTYKLVKNNPQWEFVFIGPNPEKWMLETKNIKNFHHFFEIKYEEIPSYANSFDAAIIPFKINHITKSTSPIKLYEYMAMGLPTITTGINECEKYDSIFIASDYKDFVAKINKAIGLKTNENYQKKIEKNIAENTWENRAQLIIKKLKKLNIV